jgi:FixJ family two-component response regulator
MNASNQYDMFTKGPSEMEKEIGLKNKSEVWETLSKDKQVELVKRIAYAFRLTTDNQIARSLNIAPSTVSARRNDLFKDRKAEWVLTEDKKPLKRKDPQTGKKNSVWRIVIT